MTIQPDGSALVTISHTYGPNVFTATVVATVQAGGASGTDTQVLTRCADPKGDGVKPETDIVACAFSSSGTHVTIDLTVDGNISNYHEYRVFLPQTNTVLKWFCGSASGPSGTGLKVVKVGAKTLRYTFNAAALGWNGTTPLQFKEQTKSTGWYGKLLDETAVFTITP
ncbi:MAG: hypothetical protein HC809_13220 [Gammaproteobacteria bacterium]|nr:hypothetical protein [Gammaproteobacteria bacterium]